MTVSDEWREGFAAGIRLKPESENPYLHEAQFRWAHDEWEKGRQEGLLADD